MVSNEHQRGVEAALRAHFRAIEGGYTRTTKHMNEIIAAYLAETTPIETELPAVKVKALPEKPKPVCNHVHDHVVCAGRGAAFNIYRCRYCGDEEWL
ncbi:hypothetical protein ELI20_21085 [Rhizobium ruizarguesonis]|uniref:hypothetical protein n=1 Tax=Rhizobium ruizarguesonis TaxID=2081791 RepID=UPI00103192F4|nr:hypothetical protein [Rhizobium ruizarguesonis]TAU33347.1 hypothetical protein ELI47_20765 [Rhizobium ruizarguesonis]TAW23532.1 hypothetical protein ELI20_21085 [Rhizobium ruizarguesonis]